MDQSKKPFVLNSGLVIDLINIQSKEWYACDWNASVSIEALLGADYKTAAVKLSRIYCKGQIVSKNWAN